MWSHWGISFKLKAAFNMKTPKTPLLERGLVWLQLPSLFFSSFLIWWEENLLWKTLIILTTEKEGCGCILEECRRCLWPTVFFRSSFWGTTQKWERLWSENWTHGWDNPNLDKTFSEMILLQLSYLFSHFN